MNTPRTPQALKFLLRWTIVGLALAFVLLYFFPQLLPARFNSPRSYNHAVEAVSAAVVNVYVSRIEHRRVHPLFQDPLFRRFFRLPERPKEQRNNALGSGVVMSREGYLLTNAHVVNQADEIIVTLHDGRQVEASIVGIDTETDLAALKIPLDNLTPAPLADSAQVQAGDVVLAIGNPYDLGHTVSQGIVSAIGRRRLGIATFEDFIQTDAFINPGNSGGALINADGRLIGINTAIARTSGQTQGIGFAIPINLARKVMEQLIEHGYVIRGWLGIEAQVLPRDIADAADLQGGGVLIVGVLTGGPAAVANLAPGDILISINGERLYNPQQAINLIAGFRPETIIEIELIRGWEKMIATAVVAQRPGVVN
ncbi:MAG: S1C family serine protease [Gammaproteobacteria bacterium]